MALFDERKVYKTNKRFEYPEAHKYAQDQNHVHWMHTEINFASDVLDWNTKLTDSEKNLIGSVLKGFTQTEVEVNDYWTNKVAWWFPKPEIKKMAVAFANMEGIHADSYAALNEELGLDDFEEFLEDEVTRNKLESLQDVGVGDDVSMEEKARSLAVFSAFTEGVNLFSSFAILLSFSRRDLLKKMGEVIAFSIRDESMHSEAGCWLYRQIIAEYPEIKSDEHIAQIYEAARLATSLEFAFLDNAFGMGDIEGLKKEDVIEFIKQRTNQKLEELGYDEPLYKNIDSEKVNNMNWFNHLSAGVEFQDFFAGRVTAYSKGIKNWDEEYMFEGY